MEEWGEDRGSGDVENVEKGELSKGEGWREFRRKGEEKGGERGEGVG